MNETNTLKENYVSPKSKCIEIAQASVICASDGYNETSDFDGDNEMSI